MAEQKAQKKRYDEKEMALIEATFKDQEELLVLLRRFLLQDDMTPDELAYLRAHTDNPEVMAILKKTLNPTLDKKAAIHNTVDIFSGMDLDPTEMHHAVLAIISRTKVKIYLDQRFAELEGKPDYSKYPQIIFDNLVNLEGKSEAEAYTDFTARNFMIGFIDNQGLRQLLVLASLNDTPEDIAAKAKANSSM